MARRWFSKITTSVNFYGDSVSQIIFQSSAPTDAQIPTANLVQKDISDSTVTATEQQPVYAYYDETKLAYGKTDAVIYIVCPGKICMPEDSSYLFGNTSSSDFYFTDFPNLTSINFNEKIDERKQIDQLTKNERKLLVNLLKDLTFTLKRFRPIEEAIVTAGGVSVKEINSKTMESKIIKGLYFAGEIIDVDAYTGGFNLQIAWSTGFVAGKN